MENMRMPELIALTREHRLRGYSRLRKAELIAFLQDNSPQEPPITLQRVRPPKPSRPPPPPPVQEPPRNGVRFRSDRPRQPELLRQLDQSELPSGPELTKRQLKHRRNKDSKLAKKFKNLQKEIGNLKSEMDSLKDKITKASESTNAGFKKKKIRSIKREADKINEN